MRPLAYFASLGTGRLVLWCYLIWYAVNVAYLFEPSVSLWLNSAGISAIVGTGLMLSVTNARRADVWQTVRLYMMPFCVSSYAALIKNQDYFLVFPRNARVLAVSIAACALFVSSSLALRRAAFVKRAQA